MKIKIEQNTYDSHDSFKLNAVIDGDTSYDKRISASVSSSGWDKSEAVFKAINAIDGLIECLKEAKKEIGRL